MMGRISISDLPILYVVCVSLVNSSMYGVSLLVIDYNGPYIVYDVDQFYRSEVCQFRPPFLLGRNGIIPRRRCFGVD